MKKKEEHNKEMRITNQIKRNTKKNRRTKRRNKEKYGRDKTYKEEDQKQ
jgi:hypothetical protein